MNSKRVRKAMLLSALLVIVALVALVGAQEAPLAVQYEAIADGLYSPRHLEFTAEGTLYVAEAGRGGEECIGTGEEQRCAGPTGAITVIEDDTQTRLADDLVSWAFPDGSDTTGPHDVAWDAEGNLMVIVGLGNDPAQRGEDTFFGAISDNLGQLVQVAANGSWTNEIDVSAHETAENPDGGELDSNPYALERVADGYLVADAGANALLHVADTGTITTVAVFPDRLVENPFNPSEMIPMQAVPTSIDVGPDGAYYVGQLTGFPFPVDGANIYRIEPGEEPEVYATGFTNIVDLTFDADGALYVVEITSNGLRSGDPHGSLIRVAEDGTQTVLTDDLFMPGGVAAGADGYLYVTTRTALGDGMGQVLRVNAQFTAYLPVIVPPGTAEPAP